MARKPETIIKLREAAKKRWEDPEYRKRMSEVHTGKHLSSETRSKLSAVKTGIKKSPEHKQKIGDAQKGPKNHMFGRHRTEDERRRISAGLKGFKRDEESRKKIAAAKIGENNPAFGKFGPESCNWKGGLSFEPYCEKFNFACKERVRDDFGRKCLNCGLPETENKTTTDKVIRLSVHHVRYDKGEGCNGSDFFLAPLCIKCHSMTTAGDREYWEKLLTEKRSQFFNSC